MTRPIRALIAALFLLALLATACGSASSSASVSGGPAADAAGPERIISLSPAATERLAVERATRWSPSTSSRTIRRKLR